jgi:hypothetical protein
VEVVLLLSVQEVELLLSVQEVVLSVPVVVLCPPGLQEVVLLLLLFLP